MVLRTVIMLDDEAVSLYSLYQYNFSMKKEKNESVNSNNENQKFTCEIIPTSLN